MCCIHFYFSIESDLSGEFQYLNETWAEKQGQSLFLRPRFIYCISTLRDHDSPGADARTPF